MGFYLEVPTHRQKAKYLIEHHQAKRLEFAPPTLQNHVSKDETLVCVVENGLFDAIGICYSERELQDFGYPDGRPKHWLILPVAESVKLSPHLKEYLTGERDWRS